MFITLKLTRARAAGLVLLVLAAVAGAILLIAGAGGEPVSPRALDSCQGRLAYLEKLGWDCDGETEEKREVVIPRTFGEVLQGYNAMQQEQGFDLSEYAGLTVEQYTYTLTAYPTGEPAQATLYIYQGQVIAGDIHSTALDGFLHALR